MLERDFSPKSSGRDGLEGESRGGKGRVGEGGGERMEGVGGEGKEGFFIYFVGGASHAGREDVLIFPYITPFGG